MDDVVATANGAKLGDTFQWEGRLGPGTYPNYMPFSVTPNATP